MQLEFWQQIIIILFTLYALSSFIFAIIQVNKKNIYGLTPQYYPLGAFVWGDALIFGIFWTISSITIFFLNDWILFLLFYSVFVAIRSLGETIYWFNQQFSTVGKYVLKDMPGYRWIKSDGLWFIYQIMTQCVTVISIISSIYLSAIWIKQIL